MTTPVGISNIEIPASRNESGTPYSPISTSEKIRAKSSPEFSNFTSEPSKYPNNVGFFGSGSKLCAGKLCCAILKSFLSAKKTVYPAKNKTPPQKKNFTRPISGVVNTRRPGPLFTPTQGEFLRPRFARASVGAFSRPVAQFLVLPPGPPPCLVLRPCPGNPSPP